MFLATAWRRLIRRAATSPGRLTTLTVVVVVLGLAFGLAGVLTMRAGVGLVRDVTDRSGPLSLQAQDIYRSLSDADATAASAFLANGVEPPQLRKRYLDDIARASSALTVALRGAEGRSAAALGVLVRQIPAYTGLVESARTYNRQGIPLGGAYLREASALMRQIILPAAQDLFEAESARLADAQRAVARWPWTLSLLGLLLLGALVLTQWYLVRLTNRRLNRGLVLATLAALVASGWLAVAASGAAGHIGAGRDGGSQQVALLAEARITALQARADEGLTLIARGDGKAFEQDFTVMMERLAGKDGKGGLLQRAHQEAPDDAARAAVQDAQRHAADWLTIHRKVRELDDGSQHAEAVRLATDGDASAASAAGRLDAALGEGIAGGGRRFDREAGRAGDALGGVDVAVALLALAGAAAAAYGLNQRIAEYR
ncbi:hypothetical protein Daura_32650 [Dactylosporangium aurantiacum]|uniref:Secreted protein n=1 Tax=Dactylosporangium aurantiacum TaxID=35754 RepID=A0A9Q9IBR9_9ACTN|nr:hypothetical protein [Dactylosporangium aurantiacum]MDG6107191.1 hypothetical protein [Dactylosporangium aurantiacum]UWZ51485.1 hypothetical protein Daura_32650 [Dactylosporangium aurantiacum]